MIRKGLFILRLQNTHMTPAAAALVVAKNGLALPEIPVGGCILFGVFGTDSTLWFR